jgi:cyclopropane fatty-acyl-phospholipid synthase-like methyltransferase
MRTPESSDNMTPEEWKPILGDDLHYHFGYFEKGMTLDEGVRFAVERLLPFLGRGPRVLDLGCGWGGPGRILQGRGFDVVGVTNSRHQHAYCVSVGLRTEWLDVERDDLAALGHFDSVFMMESLEHVFDKKRLLEQSALLSDRLVCITNCHALADGEPLTAFGDTLSLRSMSTLLGMLEDAGWLVRHAADVRDRSMPTFEHWKARIESTYPSGMKPAVRMLYGLCADALNNRQQFETGFPLLMVAADRVG